MKVANTNHNVSILKNYGLVLVRFKQTLLGSFEGTGALNAKVEKPMENRHRQVVGINTISSIQAN